MFDLDNLSFEELQQLRDEVNERISNHYRLRKADSKTNPCIGCSAHCRQFLLDGRVEWTCGYVICIKSRKDVNPQEAE